jgi:hypothetical protein
LGLTAGPNPLHSISNVVYIFSSFISTIDGPYSINLPSLEEPPQAMSDEAIKEVG